MSALTSAAPGVVLIANADNYVFDPGYSIGDGVDVPLSDREGKAALFEQGLLRTVESSRRLGIRSSSFSPCIASTGRSIPGTWWAARCSTSPREGA